MIRVKLQNVETGEGMMDEFPTKVAAIQFLYAHLTLWSLSKGRLPLTGFRVEIEEIP